MQLGMVGLGRMGANMVRRLMGGGHECVVQDISKEAVDALAAEGAVGFTALDAFVQRLERPRAICLMVPAAIVMSSMLAKPLVAPRRRVPVAVRVMSSPTKAFAIFSSSTPADTDRS